MYSYNNYSKEAHMKQYNWATLGCGVIANELANALSKQGRTLYSVANRTHEKAVSFAQKYGIISSDTAAVCLRQAGRR